MLTNEDKYISYMEEQMSYSKTVIPAVVKQIKEMTPSEFEKKREEIVEALKNLPQMDFYDWCVSEGLPVEEIFPDLPGKHSPATYYDGPDYPDEDQQAVMSYIDSRVWDDDQDKKPSQDEDFQN